MSDSPETGAWWVGGPVIGDILLNVSACCISVFLCLTIKNKLVKCREFSKASDFSKNDYLQYSVYLETNKF